MLRVMRQGSRWIMWVVILGVGGVFVLYLGLRGGGRSGSHGPETLIQVGSRHYNAKDVYRLLEIQEERLRQSLGDKYDPDTARKFLIQQVGGTLLRQALLADEGERLGLAVSDDEMRDYLRSIPGAVDENGRLKKDLITASVERQYGSVRRFQDSIHDELLADKASRLIRDGAAVSKAEARDALLYKMERVRVAVVKIEAAKPAKDAKADPAAVKALLENDPQRVKQAYDQRRDEFDRPEEVRARHILIRVAPDASKEQREAARKHIEAIRARIAGGADFADVAMQESEDPGSKAKGGDLGFFPRGRMVKAFEDAAFSLQPGVLSKVVETENGFHLILVEAKRPARVVPFEEASEQIASDLVLADAARDAARAKAQELAKLAEEKHSLVDAARAEKLPIERPDPLMRRPDGYIPGIGTSPELLTAAFSLSAERPRDGRVYPVGDDAFALVELLERIEPSEAQIKAALPTERKRLLDRRRNEFETAWLTTRRDELKSKGDLVFDLSDLERR